MGYRPDTSPAELPARCEDAELEAARNPDYLRKLATATQQFREAFDRFTSLHVFNENLARGIAPAVFAKDNAVPAESSVRRPRCHKQRSEPEPSPV